MKLQQRHSTEVESVLTMQHMRPRILRFMLLALLVLGGLSWWSVRTVREKRYDPQIFAAARRYGVDPALIKAVCWQESRFKANARGTVGELGLMQIGKAAAQDWADAEQRISLRHEHLLDPDLNTMCGAWYLRKLLLRYRQTDAPMTYALADYNAGRSNVLRWTTGAGSTNSQAFLAQMDFPTTRAYVDSVTQRYLHYRPIMALRAAR